MFHQFDHRWATYTADSDTHDLTNLEKGNPHFLPQPRYWVEHIEVENRSGDKWNKDWLLAFRDVCRSNDERTTIFSCLPIGIGNNAPTIITDLKETRLISCLLSNFCSLTFDFVTRHQLGGVHMNFFILKSLPVIPLAAYSSEDIKFISSRVLELVYTTWDMQPFAQDMGYD